MTFNQGVPGSIPGWITKSVYSGQYAVNSKNQMRPDFSRRVCFLLFTDHCQLSTLSAPVAQLDRAIASDAMCRAFESHQAYQSNKKCPALQGIFCSTQWTLSAPLCGLTKFHCRHCFCSNCPKGNSVSRFARNAQKQRGC